MLDQIRQRVGTWRRSPRVRRWAPWLVLAAGLAGEAAVLLVQDRHLWFFRDDIGFLLGRHISDHPVSSLLKPHNEHWSTLPLLAFRAMWHLFGFRHYMPYAVMPLLLHLALAACLALLVRRAGAGVWPAVLAGLVFAYLGGGAGAENTLWAFQIGFIGSCLGGFIALLCFDLALAHHEDRAGRRWFWIGQASLVAALMCSGLGVPMVITAGAWALLRRGPAAALRTVALPVVVFAGWYAGWGHTGFTNAEPLHVGLVRGPLAAAHGIGNIWGAGTGVPGAGPAVLLALVVAVVRSRRKLPALFALGAAGLLGLVCEYLIVGFGRSKWDLDYVLHSRYLYIGVALCTPAVACLFELLARWLRELAASRRARSPNWLRAVQARANAWTWLVVALLVVVVGSAETAHYAAQRRAEDPARKQEMLAAAALIRRRAPLLSDRIDPSDTHRHPAMSVSHLLEAHALAELPRGPVSSTALFDERSVLQVNVRNTPMDLAVPRAYYWSDHWIETADDAPSGRMADALRGCTARKTTISAGLDIPLGRRGAQVEIRFRPQDHSDPALRTRILRRGHASVATTWMLNSGWGLSGPRFFVGSDMHYATLQVFFPAGNVRVCGGERSRPARAGH